MKEDSNERYGLLPKFMLALCLSTMAFGAWAQDEAAAEGDEATTEDESADLGRILVTGSLLKREEFTSTSPMQIINAETQAQVGQLSVAEILQGTTIAGGTTQWNNQFNGFVVQGGAGIQTLDLRGLGDNRTLVLLNGRRPGGSGVRGQVSSLDLAMIPEIAAQRFEIVLDGSSSIYGSDAVSGVANIITRRSVDRTEVQALAEIPFETGGERYRFSAITGLNFDKGNVMLSAQFERQAALRVGDRDYLGCLQDIAYDESGNRIDRLDRSITANEPYSGCQNLYANTAIDLFTGRRYIPAPDGVTIGPMPGYRPRANGRYDDPGGVAYYEDVLDFPFTRSAMALNQMERFNVYATSDFTFDILGGVDWDVDFLYSTRETVVDGWRQFFPAISSADFIPYPNDPTWMPSPGFAFSLPVMPFPVYDKIEVEYIYLTTGLTGMLPTRNFWSWQLYGSYSKSDGDYTENFIQGSLSGDIDYDDSPPRIDYFDPAILSGRDMQTLIDTVGGITTGNTVYDQYQVVGILSGDLFQLPAGMVGAAFGVEYRDFSIDDQPSEFSQGGDIWGGSSALITQGSNKVWEGFLELEVPILADIFLVEELTVNGSARYFDYDVGGSDSVWKAGVKWALTPSFMLRGTAGTSYRAPALFELFLGDETSFVGQTAIDPCIDWGQSTNANVRRNCAAEGIPDNYTGAGSSATVTSGGGAENLEPETSDAMTAGFVWTPQFADLSIAVDWYEIEVNNEIDQLGSSAILGGCYNAENFPNSFCDLFTRAPGTGTAFPWNILTVDDTFINVNEQRVEGVDLNLRWNQDVGFGRLVVEAQSSYYIENVQRLFDPTMVEGFETTDYVGTVGSPDLLANVRVGLERNDWTFTYYLQYVADTNDSPFVDEIDSYFGFEDARFDITMDEAFYHSISVMYRRDNWDVLVGINNLLDEEPDMLSDVYRGFLGWNKSNVPVAASQYDILGRRLFARVNLRF